MNGKGRKNVNANNIMKFTPRSQNKYKKLELNQKNLNNNAVDQINWATDTTHELYLNKPLWYNVYMFGVFAV